jgi:hypothetical protein
LYLRALGRPATAEEVVVARQLLGSAKDPAAVRQEGWEDFLWLLFLSPEFQFLR